MQIVSVDFLLNRSLLAMGQKSSDRAYLARMYAKGPVIVKVYWFEIRDLGHRVNFSIYRRSSQKTNVLFQMGRISSVPCIQETDSIE